MAGTEPPPAAARPGDPAPASAPGAAAPPRNAVVILLDSLNRHLLGAYGSTEFGTPNLDRLARRSVRFDQHHAGSLPCMPARHDILCGAVDFLWKPWGSVELWESPITVPLRRAGVTTMLVTDHPHLFEVGGENYHCDFTAWDYQRGGEGDPWKTRPDPSWIGTPHLGGSHVAYDNSRGWFRGEDDFPGPRTMAAAAAWLADHAPHHDRFLLFVDEFDPHEPFDAPEPYASRYDPGWQGPHLIWPPYTPDGVASGAISPAQARQIRASYGAKLTMIDHWLGRVLDVLDAGNLWDSTAVFLCSDHGHYLGEKDIWGKPWVPVYEPLGHIPLLVSWPGVAPGSCSALTTSVDLHATIADIFGAVIEHRTHGRSIRPLLDGSASSVRDYVLAGVYGREVKVTTGAISYSRAPSGENAPLSMWSNRWSTMPVYSHPELRLPVPDDRAVLDKMPGSAIPVIRQPFTPQDFLPWWAYGEFHGNHLYDIAQDPAEDDNLAGAKPESEAADLLREALLEIEAPADQLDRLGLG